MGIEVFYKKSNQTEEIFLEFLYINKTITLFIIVFFNENIRKVLLYELNILLI